MTLRSNTNNLPTFRGARVVVHNPRMIFAKRLIAYIAIPALLSFYGNPETAPKTLIITSSVIGLVAHYVPFHSIRLAKDFELDGYTLQLSVVLLDQQYRLSGHVYFCVHYTHHANILQKSHARKAGT